MLESTQTQSESGVIVRPIHEKSFSPFVPDIETNYNCLLRPNLLSRLFGYNTQTFRNWESDQEHEGRQPTLHPRILDDSKSRVRRLYRIEDVLEIYKYTEEQQSESRPAVDRTRTIAIWNNKGGVGKSIVAANLAATMSALMGLKVLVIDCDSQMDLTWIMGCLKNKDDKTLRKGGTLRHIMGFIDTDENGRDIEVQMPFEDAKLALSPTLDLIPANEDLNELDFDFSYLNGLFTDSAGNDVSRVASVKERFLNEYILNNKTNYDVVIFDCAPNKGLLNVNILYAVDQLIIPIGVQAKSEHSMENVQKWLTKLNNLNSGFTFEDIKAVLNLIDIRENIKLDGIEKLEQKYQRSILSNIYFPKSTVVDQAEFEQEPIFQRAADSVKTRSVPLAKRLANSFWELSHECLGLKPKTLLFPEVIY